MNDIIYSTIALLGAFPIFQVSTPKTKKLSRNPLGCPIPFWIPYCNSTRLPGMAHLTCWNIPLSCIISFAVLSTLPSRQKGAY